MFSPEAILSLQDQCNQIEAAIWEDYIDVNEKCEPIIDGIVNIEKYLNSAFKILWILKEPYDDVQDEIAAGGGWHLGKDFLYPDGFYSRIGRSRNTWYPIIYTSFGILNNFMLWNDMEDISKDYSMAEIVRHIAIINVKKLPGFTRTQDYGIISDAFHKHKTLLLNQISTYNPDIIIGGSTLRLFYTDLAIDKTKDEKKYGCVEYVIKNTTLYISAYHPAQTKVLRKDYVNDIVNLVKAWSQKML